MLKFYSKCYLLFFILFASSALLAEEQVKDFNSLVKEKADVIFNANKDERLNITTAINESLKYLDTIAGLNLEDVLEKASDKEEANEGFKLSTKKLPVNDGESEKTIKSVIEDILKNPESIQKSVFPFIKLKILYAAMLKSFDDEQFVEKLDKYLSHEREEDAIDTDYFKGYINDKLKDINFDIKWTTDASGNKIAELEYKLNSFKWSEEKNNYVSKYGISSDVDYILTTSIAVITNVINRTMQTIKEKIILPIKDADRPELKEILINGKVYNMGGERLNLFGVIQKFKSIFKLNAIEQLGKVLETSKKRLAKLSNEQLRKKVSDIKAIGNKASEKTMNKITDNLARYTGYEALTPDNNANEMVDDYVTF